MRCEESKVGNACTLLPPTVIYWDPSSYYDAGKIDGEIEWRQPSALLILNQKITKKGPFVALWKNCQKPYTSTAHET